MNSLLFYLLAIIAATPSQAYWLVQLLFWIFAAYLFNFFKHHPIDWRQSPQPTAKKYRFTFFIIVVFFFTIRLIPLIKWRKVIPFGADNAVYLKDFSPYFLYPSYLIFSLLIILAVYLLADYYFGQKAAIASAFLYAVSVPQFLAYYAFYWKMAGAIGLFLIAFYLLEKEDWLAVPLAAIAGALHLPSLLPFGLTMIMKLIFGKNRLFTFFAGTMILLAVAALIGRPFIEYASYYTTSPILASTKYLQGQYINLEDYRSMALLYLPFAVLGIIYLVKKKQFNYLLFFIIANLIPITLGFVFYQRFLILLDLALIISAGPLFAGFSKNKIIFAILIVGAIIMILQQSLIAAPFVTDPKEIEEIRSLSKITEPTAVIASYSYLYEPYLKGLSKRKIVDKTREYDYLFVGNKMKKNFNQKEFPNLTPLTKNVWKNNK